MFTFGLSVVVTALLSVCTALPIHSHNDCEFNPYPSSLGQDLPSIIVDLQDAPLFTALDVGILSVEADVWLRDGQLYVIHLSICGPAFVNVIIFTQGRAHGRRH